MAHEPELNLPNPWAAVGRDTEAGRALFALYNGFGHARSRGNDYSQINRMKHLRHIAMHGVPEFPTPKHLPPKKPEVKVPHFPHKGYCADDYHPVDFIPRRRRAAEILQQIRDDSYVVELPPMPNGPLLDEAEKARLQEVFYWSNRTLAPEPPVAEPVRRLPKKGSIEEQELLLNEIAKEIEDRETFLNEMEEYGKGDQYRGQIMFEIQQRVGQMKLLHETITEQEKRENEKKSEIPSPRSQLYIIAPPPKSHARGQGHKAHVKTLHFNTQSDTDPRFERPSNSTRQPTQDPGTYTTSLQADETPGQRSSQQDASFWTDPSTAEPFAPNVIRTASCYGNAAPAASSPESQPPTPPPTKLSSSAPRKKILNLNLNLNSPPNSAGSCSTPSIRSDPRNRASARFPQSGGKSSEGNTSRVTSNSDVNYPSDSSPCNECASAGSPARSPLSITSDSRSRAVRFQQLGGGNSDRFMCGMSPNSNADCPSGPTPCDEFCSPPDLERSKGNVRFNERSGGNLDPFMGGVTSNSDGNFQASQSSPWDDEYYGNGSPGGLPLAFPATHGAEHNV